MSSGGADTGPWGLFPRRHGDYLLLDRIARGGSGDVLLARVDGLLGIKRHVVIKMLKEDLLADEESINRFCDEARVLVQLEHRNICRVLDVGRAEGRYYIAMEHIAGRDLARILERLAARKQTLPQEVALYIACELLEALDHAHRCTDRLTGEPLHVVHRDVSPQNVMLTFEGEVRLIDFGIAASTIKNAHTRPRFVLGKLAYMSPEQARGERVGPDSDVFAAGIVLFEMLTGRRFYSSRDPAAIRETLRSGQHVHSELLALPDTLTTPLLAALELDRSKRPGSAAAMRAALVEHQRQAGQHVGAPEARALLEGLFQEERALERARLRTLLSVSLPAHEATVAEPTQRFAVADEIRLGGLRSDSQSSTALARPRPDLAEQATALDAAPTPSALTGDALLMATTLDEGDGEADPPRTGETPVLGDPVLAAAHPPARGTPKPSPTSSRSFLVAGLATVLFAAMAALVVLSADPPDQPSAPAAPAMVSAEPSPLAADAAGSAERRGAAAPAPAPALSEAAQEPAPATLAPAAAPPTRPAPGTTTAQQPAPRKPDPPRARPAPPRAALPPSPRFLRDKVLYLGEHCAAVGCSTPLVRRLDSLPAMSPGGARTYREAVDACIEACQRARR
ncbi:MAG: hypothetical protein A2138_20975 [Deltaproteobacteria bacterium RBG_16_71_12]|nr:MAG: hypothetical protein A2138_20975 [Deltaproteobacteria bacterium RBG_16_71_12]